MRIRPAPAQGRWHTAQAGRLLALLVAAGLVAWPGCQRGGGSATTRPVGGQPVEKVATRGPLAVVVRTDRGEYMVGDRVRLTLDVTAPEGFEIALPKRPDVLGELRVANAQDYGDVPVAEGRRWRRVYELDADLSGDFELPAQTVRYADRRAPGVAPATQASQPTHEMDSPALTVTVVSALKGEFDPAEYSDIKGPVALPYEFDAAWLWLALLPVLAVLLLLLVLVKRKHRVPVAPPVPVVRPDVWAREQLRLLRAERLVEQGLVAEFFFRLTGIIREYIERRFAVRAPEQTTEEFLAAAQGHPALGVRYGRLLTDFLEAGDLVKFARYRPGTAEIDRAFETAEAFVEQRAVDGVPVDTDSPSPPDVSESPRSDGGSA